MTVKSKASIKPKAAVKPNKKISSKQNDLSQLSEDIISNVGVGIYIVQHGKFIFASPLYQRLTGYSATEIIGHNSLDHVHPDDKAMVRTKAIKSLKGKSHSYEYRFIRKNGEGMWILEMVTSIIYKGEHATLGSFMDITEHKRIEDKLRRSEEKYRTILENIEDGYAEMDLHGNFIFFNEELCRIHGYPKEELLKKNYHDLMDEENAQKIFKEYNEVFTSGKSKKEVPYEVITKNGARKYLETSITPMKDASGRIFAFRGIVRDRTEHKQAEDALQKTEEKYRGILENIEDGYFEVDLAGNFTFCNNSVCRIHGYSKEELMGMNNRQYTDKEDAKKLFQAFNKVYNTGEPSKGFDWPIIRKDGTKRYLEASISLQKDSSGKPTGFRGISRDITERKQMEEALRKSEERYRNILESIDDGYCEQDLAGNFTFINDSMCRIYGYPKEELMGMNYKQYTDKESGEKCFQAYRNIYKTEEPGKVFDFEIIRKDGTKRHIESSVSLQKDSAGKPIAFRGIVRDITERKQAEEALQNSEERYRTIIENIADGYFELDLTGKFTFVNDAQCKIAGTPREQLLGKSNMAYTNKEEAKRVYQIFNGIYRTGEPAKGFAFEFTKQDGTKGFNEISVSLIKDSEGKPSGFRGIARDVTERKQMEEALQKSEERYRNILESIQEGYFEVDLQGTYTFVNEANARFLGYTKEELVGMNSRQHMDEEIAKKIYQPYRELYLTGKPIETLEVESIRKDGTKVIYETSVSLIRDAKGKPIGYRGVSRDATERILHENELTKFLAAMDMSADSIYMVDRSTMRFINVNTTACEKMGYSREELLKMGPHELLMMDRKELEQMYDEVIASGSAGIRTETFARYKDGRQSVAELHRRALRSGDSWIIVSIAHDITLRKRTEQASLLLGRMFAALSATNEAIMQVKSPEELYQRVCDAAVGGGKFITTGVLLFDPGTTWVRVAAVSGAGADRLRAARISLDEAIPEGRGLVGTAFRTSKPCVSNDYLKDAVSLAWRENAKNVGSIAVMPLLRDGQVIGALIFYATEKRAFDDEIINLLERMAENVVFALDNFELEARRKLLEEAIRQSEEKYRTIIDEMEEWYFETDLAGKLLYFNDALVCALGYPQKELTGLNFRALIKQEQAEEIYKIFHQVYEIGEPIKNFPQEFIRPDGSITFAEFSIFPKRDHKGKIFGFRGVGHDITERKRVEQELSYMATHDSLTGLPNRMLFMDRLKMALAHAKRNKQKLAVMMLDLDRFKNINDTLGHMVGDRLLKEIGLRLTGLLRQNDTISRLGGDEFIILLPEIVQMEDSAEVAEKILKATQQPFICDSHKLITSTSIGIAIYPDDCQDMDSLIKNADMAMYSVKAHGRNSYQFFTKTNFDQSG